MTDVKSIWDQLALLKDNTEQKTEQIAELPIQFRLLFDTEGNEGKEMDTAGKQVTLQGLISDSIDAIDLLFFHLFYYRSMRNYDHVVEAAPWSAFELMWQGNQLYKRN